MWVVKIGGSLCADPVLPHWLDLLAEVGGGRVTVVCGGGSLADEVRRLQAHWDFDDLAAHNMAVLAMAQTAYQFHAINPRLRLALRKVDIPRVLREGRTALWVPLELQRDTPDPRTHWGATSDTIALDLARRLNAERLVVVKSCPIDPQLDLAAMSERDILDRRFAELSRGAAFPIEVIHKAELARVRSALLGESRHHLSA